MPQGFLSFHFTPFEVLLEIEQCEKRLNHKFSPEEIENGCLKDVLIEVDYDILKAVSTYLLNFQTSDVSVNKLKNE